MLTRSFAAMALATVLVNSFGSAVPRAQAQAPGTIAGNGSVVCSVMETFEDGKLGVRAVIFHQRDKMDGPRLGSLFLAHAGEQMDLEMAGGIGRPSSA